MVVIFEPPAKVKGSGRVEVEAPKLPGISGHVAVPLVDVVVAVAVVKVVRVVGCVV